MTRVNEKAKGRPEALVTEQDQRRRRKRRVAKRPCGSDTPLAPTGLDLQFDNTHKDRRRRWRAKMVVSEVTQNEYGADTTVDQYVFELQHSLDGSTPLGDANQSQKAKIDEADSQAYRIVNRVRRRYYYRFRARAINADGCKSAWSAYSGWEQPNQEAPPTPTDVTIFEKDNQCVPVEWDAPDDDVDPDDFTGDIDEFRVQWATDAGFANVVRQARRKHGTRANVRFRKAQLGPFIYARVRSVNAEGDKSDWVNARLNGNSSTTATPDGVKPGRSRRVTANFTKSGAVEVKTYPQGWTADEDYVIVGVRVRVGHHAAATHPADGCPSGGDLTLNIRIEDDAGADQGVFTADNRLTVVAGNHKAVDSIREGESGFNKTEILRHETAFVKVISAAGAEDMVVFLILEAAEG